MKHTHVISCPSPNIPCDVCATPNDTSATQRCHAPKNVKLHLGSVHLPTSTVQGSNKAQCDNIHNYHQLSHDPELPVISSCFSYLKLSIPPDTSLGFPHNFASRALATCWTALKFNAHKSKHDKLWQVDFVYLWRNFCQRNGEAKTSTQFHKCIAWSGEFLAWIFASSNGIAMPCTAYSTHSSTNWCHLTISWNHDISSSSRTLGWADWRQEKPL